MTPEGKTPESQNAAGELWTQGVIEQNRRWLLAYLYAVTGDRALAEDLVQETFVIAYQKRDEFRKGEAFGAWLRGIAKNVARRALETRVRRPTLRLNEAAWTAMDLRAASLEQDHVNPDYQENRLSLLRRCLGKLTDRSRRIIDARYNEGLDTVSLAKRYGLSAASIPVILHRARTAISACIRRGLALTPWGGGL